MLPWLRIAGAACALVLLAAFGAAAREGYDAFPARAADGDATKGLSDLDRHFLPLRAYDIDVDAHRLALEHIPLDATYALVTGPDTVVSSALVLSKVDALAPWAFLPRRRVDPAQAQWIVSYGVKAGTGPLAGIRFARVYDTGNGRWVGEVQR